MGHTRTRTNCGNSRDLMLKITSVSSAWRAADQSRRIRLGKEVNRIFGLELRETNVELDQ